MVNVVYCSVILEWVRNWWLTCRTSVVRVNVCSQVVELLWLPTYIILCSYDVKILCLVGQLSVKG